MEHGQGFGEVGFRVLSRVHFWGWGDGHAAMVGIWFAELAGVVGPIRGGSVQGGDAGYAFVVQAFAASAYCADFAPFAENGSQVFVIFLPNSSGQG